MRYGEDVAVWKAERTVYVGKVWDDEGVLLYTFCWRRMSWKMIKGWLIE